MVLVIIINGFTVYSNRKFGIVNYGNVDVYICLQFRHTSYAYIHSYTHSSIRMLPDCIACIPGTIAAPQSKSCNTFISDAKNIRDEIFNLTLERFPQRSEDRKFGLYPCRCRSCHEMYVLYVC